MGFNYETFVAVIISNSEYFGRNYNLVLIILGWLVMPPPGSNPQTQWPGDLLYVGLSSFFLSHILRWWPAFSKVKPLQNTLLKSALIQRLWRKQWRHHMVAFDVNQSVHTRVKLTSHHLYRLHYNNRVATKVRAIVLLISAEREGDVSKAEKLCTTESRRWVSELVLTRKTDEPIRGNIPTETQRRLQTEELTAAEITGFHTLNQTSFNTEESSFI